VLVAGVKVGEVERLGLDHATAVARLSLDPEADLRRDVTARVRARSLLGEKYVELIPVTDTAPALVDGDVILLDREQVEMDEIVDRLAPLLQAIDPEALASAVRSMSDAIREDPDRVARMLRNADAILVDGAAASDRLPGLLDRADATLGGADRAVDLLRRRLAEAQAPVAKASEVLDDLKAASEPLDEAVAEARSTLGDVRSAVRKADGLLGAFDGLEPDLRRIVRNVAEIDKWELRRLLREEGILIRMHPRGVEAPAPAP
jgi:phospholipid/cholesterol/gamma-HCH transport system substrate-binding protein